MWAGYNVTTAGPPWAGSTELAGRIWPAGLTLPNPAPDVVYRLSRLRWWIPTTLEKRVATYWKQRSCKQASKSRLSYHDCTATSKRTGTAHLPMTSRTCSLQMIMGLGMGLPFPLEIPWEWELMTQLGMGIGRNGNHRVWEWEWEWPLFSWK